MAVSAILQTGPGRTWIASRRVVFFNPIGIASSACRCINHKTEKVPMMRKALISACAILLIVSCGGVKKIDATNVESYFQSLTVITAVMTESEKKQLGKDLQTVISGANGLANVSRNPAKYLYALEDSQFARYVTLNHAHLIDGKTPDEIHDMAVDLRRDSVFFLIEEAKKENKSNIGKTTIMDLCLLNMIDKKVPLTGAGAKLEFCGRLKQMYHEELAYIEERARAAEKHDFEKPFEWNSYYISEIRCPIHDPDWYYERCGMAIPR